MRRFGIYFFIPPPLIYFRQIGRKPFRHFPGGLFRPEIKSAEKYKKFAGIFFIFTKPGPALRRLTSSYERARLVTKWSDRGATMDDPSSNTAPVQPHDWAATHAQLRVFAAMHVARGMPDDRHEWWLGGILKAYPYEQHAGLRRSYEERRREAEADYAGQLGIVYGANADPAPRLPPGYGYEDRKGLPFLVCISGSAFPEAPFTAPPTDADAEDVARAVTRTTALRNGPSPVHAMRHQENRYG